MVPHDLLETHYRHLQPPPPPLPPPNSHGRTPESTQDILAALAMAEAAALPTNNNNNSDHHIHQLQQIPYQYFVPSLPKSQLPPYPHFDIPTTTNNNNNINNALPPFALPHSAPPPPLNLPSPTASVSISHLPQSAPPLNANITAHGHGHGHSNGNNISTTIEANNVHDTANTKNGHGNCNRNLNANMALPHSAPPPSHPMSHPSLPHRHVVPSPTIERASAIFDKFFPMSSPTTTIASVASAPNVSPTFPGVSSAVSTPSLSLPLLPSVPPKASPLPLPASLSVPMKRKRSSSAAVTGGVCSECGKCFFKSGALARHMKSAHPNSVVIPLHSSSSLSSAAAQKNAPVERLDCPRCEKTFSQQGSLNRHLRSIHEARKLHCRYCSLAFGQAFDLKRHQRRKHPGRATAVPTQALPAIVIRGGRAHAHNRS